MKKILTIVAVALLTCALAVSVSAVDETTGLPVKTADEDGFFNGITYSVTGAIEGENYGMVVIPYEDVDTDATTIAIPTIDDDNILYIDQVTADANGEIAFGKFAPRAGQVIPEDADVAKCILFIGGKACGDNAQAIYVLEYTPSSQVTISGKVTDGETDRLAKITVKDSNGSPIITPATANADGTYSISVAPGENYTVEFTKDAYGVYAVTGVNLSESVTINADVSTLVGNINGDSQITMEDLVDLLADYGENAGSLENEFSNINNDSQVTMEDLVLLLGCYGNNNISVAYAN